MATFVDSGSAPTVAQVQEAVAQGYRAWGFYRAGDANSEYHVWTDAEVATLHAGGMQEGLPIYVPLMVNGRISPSAVPETDAADFVASYQSIGVNGAAALDTEASMRGDPWTAQYEQRFAAQLRNLGQADITYAGGFTLSAPPSATYRWWIMPGAVSASPTEACQAGQTTIAGISVDIDVAGIAFPFASLGGNMPLLTDVMDSWSVPGTDGNAYFDLHYDGGLFAYGGAVPTDLEYVACANDGSRYHFGPKQTPGVISYPGLPANDRAGVRYFRKMTVLTYKGVPAERGPEGPPGSSADLAPILNRLNAAGKALEG